jgi:hypothetical protein
VSFILRNLLAREVSYLRVTIYMIWAVLLVEKNWSIFWAILILFVVNFICVVLEYAWVAHTTRFKSPFK